MIWSLIAKVLAIPPVAQFLYRLAEPTPYVHIKSPNGENLYMGRWWLFNPYDPDTKVGRWPHLPSVRIHYIRRPDQDRALHDHPWNARTIILAGNYVEERIDGSMVCRAAGDTNRLNYGEFHRIAYVHPQGCWTLFITGKYRGTWGFLVNGMKVPYRRYLGLDS